MMTSPGVALGGVPIGDLLAKMWSVGITMLTKPSKELSHWIATCHVPRSTALAMVTFTTKVSPTFFEGEVKLKSLEPSAALTSATVPAACAGRVAKKHVLAMNVVIRIYVRSLLVLFFIFLSPAISNLLSYIEWDK
jgi:hypothetical protein